MDPSLVSVPGSPATLPGAFPMTVKKPAARSALSNVASDPDQTPAPSRAAQRLAVASAIRTSADWTFAAENTKIPGKWDETSSLRPSPPNIHLPSRTPPGELLDQPSHLLLDDPFAGEDLSDVEPDNSVADFRQEIVARVDVEFDETREERRVTWTKDGTTRTDPPTMLGEAKMAASSTATLAPSQAEDEISAAAVEPSFGFSQFDPWASPRGPNNQRASSIAQTPVARLARLHALQTPANKVQSPLALGSPASGKSLRNTPQAAEAKINDSVKEMMQKQVADLREFADNEINFRDEMISELQRNVDSLRTARQSLDTRVSTLEEENRILAEESEQRMRRNIELDAALQKMRERMDRMELHGAADLERDLRRASLASDSRPNLDQKRQTGELRAQLQELSELYEGEMQRRSEAETTKIEMEQAMERLKEDHAAELRACQDHANTHVAMYRKKCKDLKTNLLEISTFVVHAREALAVGLTPSSNPALIRLRDEAEMTTIYAATSNIDVFAQNSSAPI